MVLKYREQIEKVFSLVIVDLSTSEIDELKERKVSDKVRSFKKLNTVL